MAAEVEYHRITKYQELDSVYRIVPLAIETSGAFGPKAATFFTDLGKWVVVKVVVFFLVLELLARANSMVGMRVASLDI